jgi:hypothetical protein
LIAEIHLVSRKRLYNQQICVSRRSKANFLQFIDKWAGPDALVSMETIIGAFARQADWGVGRLLCIAASM